MLSKIIRIIRKAFIPNFVKSELDSIKSLKRRRSKFDLGLPGANKIVSDYFGQFTRQREYEIGSFTIEGRASILGQFEKVPPGLAKYGFIQIALSYYMNRYLVDVKTGEVFSFEAPMLAHELYEWDKAGRKQELGPLLRECADDTFTDIVALFDFIQNDCGTKGPRPE